MTGQNQQIISGWWLTYPSEKYESQLGTFFPIYGKIKNVPNHQPDMGSVVQNNTANKYGCVNKEYCPITRSY